MINYNNKLFKFMLIIVMSGLVFGIDAGLVSGTIKFIKAEFGLSSLQVGTVVSAPAFGAIIALLFSGSLVDRLGRKKMMVIIGIFYMISAVLSTFATSYMMLVLARMLGGMAFCCLSIAAMYIGELAPSDKRGRYVASNQVMMGVGFFLAYLFNYVCILLLNENSMFFSTENIWRTMFATEIPVVTIWILLLYFIPESPRWLMKKGRDQEALQVISQVNPPENVDLIVAEIKENLASVESNISVGAQLKIMFSTRMRKILIIGIGLGVVQSFSGMGAISYYSPMIFEQVGLGQDSAFFQTTLLGLISIVFSLIAMSLVDKHGRKLILVVGLLAICLSHLSIWYGFDHAKYDITEAGMTKIENVIDVTPLKNDIGKHFTTDKSFKEFIHSKYDEKDVTLHEGAIINAFITLNSTLIVAAIFIFKAAFFFSIGPMMWVVLSEITPNVIRSVAIPTFGLIASLTAFFVQKFFPWQLSTFGAADTFLIYGVCSFLGVILVIFILPETKNKSLEEIERHLTS